MWLREQIGPQYYTVNSSILWLGLNKDEHPSPCVVCLVDSKSKVGLAPCASSVSLVRIKVLS